MAASLKGELMIYQEFCDWLILDKTQKEDSIKIQENILALHEQHQVQLSEGVSLFFSTICMASMAAK